MFRKITNMISNNKTDPIVIYTDGSCVGNGKANAKGGIGIFYNITSLKNTSLSYEDTVKILKLNIGHPTNNKTELLAVLLALKINDFLLNDNKHIVIKTDSKYVIDSLTKWYHAWLKNDWMNSSNKPVLNKEIIEQIVFIILKYKNQISFEHVRAHTVSPSVNSKEFPDWFGNDMADKFAQLASTKGSLPKEMVDRYIKEGW